MLNLLFHWKNSDEPIITVTSNSPSRYGCKRLWSGAVQIWHLA